MASFVEQAVLDIKDSASGDIKKVNRELKQLFRTAKQLQGLGKTKSIGLDVRGLTKAKSEISGITREVNRLKSSARGGIPLRINASAAQRTLQQLRTQGQRPIRTPVSAQAARGGGGLFGGGRSLAQMTAGFLAVSGAANLAAAALRGVAESAATRDRTNLQLAAGATEAQRNIINAAKGPTPAEAPIRFTEDQRRSFTQSLLGDIQPPKGMTGKEAEEFRAKAAVQIAAQLEREVLPRQFALNPEKTPEQAQEGLRALVKAMNLASSQIVDASGNLSNEGLRVLEAEMLAMAADPDISPELINTTLRGLKTKAFALGTTDLATVLINAGARGQRAGNEAFQALKSLVGEIDNKALNNALADAGILKGVKRNKKGNVIAGSGTVVDEEQFQTDFQGWIVDHIVTPMNKALGEGATQAQKEAWIGKQFPGARATAVQAISDYTLGGEQIKASLEQARSVLGEDIGQALKDSWTSQLESTKTSLTDSAAKWADAAAKQVDAAGLLEAAAKNPGWTTLAGAGAALVASATALTGAAAAVRGLGGVGGGGTTGTGTGRFGPRVGGAALGGLGAGGLDYLITGDPFAAAGTAIGGVIGGAIGGPLGLASGAAIGHVIGEKFGPSAAQALKPMLDDFVNNPATKALVELAKPVAEAVTPAPKPFAEQVVHTEAERERGLANLGSIAGQIAEIDFQLKQLQQDDQTYGDTFVNLWKQREQLIQQQSGAIGTKGGRVGAPMDIIDPARFGETIDTAFTQGYGTFQTIDNMFATTFATAGPSIATSMTNAGPTVGTSIASQFQSLAPSIGQIIGTNAASVISGAKVNVSMPSAGSAVDTGTQAPIE